MWSHIKMLLIIKGLNLRAWQRDGSKCSFWSQTTVLEQPYTCCVYWASKLHFLWFHYVLEASLPCRTDWWGYIKQRCIVYATTPVSSESEWQLLGAPHPGIQTVVICTTFQITQSILAFARDICSLVLPKIQIKSTELRFPRLPPPNTSWWTAGTLLDQSEPCTEGTVSSKSPRAFWPANLSFVWPRLLEQEPVFSVSGHFKGIRVGFAPEGLLLN